MTIKVKNIYSHNTASTDSPADSDIAVTISCTATDGTGGFEWQRKYDDGSWQALTDECDETVTLEATESPGKYKYRARPYGSTSANDWQESDDVYIVGVSSVQYKMNGTWTTVPAEGFKNVCVGSQIEFKAISTPSGVSWPTGFPTWGAYASGIGEEKTVTFSSSGPKNITTTCGNTITTIVHVADANAAVSIVWDHTYSCDNNSARSITTKRDFDIAYTAHADIANNKWYLRVISITGGTDILVHMHIFKTPVPGVNITNATEGIAAITDMLLESDPTGPAKTWLTEDSIRVHEEWHRDEWTETSEHYWPPTEISLENIAVSYNAYVNDPSAAVASMRSGANGKNIAYKDMCNAYWISLGDSPGDRPFRAGGIVLNPLIEAIRVYGAAQTPPWAGLPSGTNAGPGTDHCYMPWLPYNP